MSKAETNSVLIPTGTPAEAFLRRVAAGPMLVAEEHAELFVANIREITQDENFKQFSQVMFAEQDDDEFWDQDDWMVKNYRPYLVKNGVLTVPISGSLLSGFSYCINGYATGYEYIQRVLERGMADQNVEKVLFHVNSPGGHVAGNFELVEYITSLRGVKPMLAVAAGMALSGGFSIATAADELVVTRSGWTGSVGVLAMHIDYSEMLGKAGVKVTMVAAGKHKTDGNRYEPLSKDAKDRMQAGVDKTYALFVSTVASNRGMNESDVRETEALVYDAEESVQVGFADRIGEFREEVSAFETRNIEGSQPMAKDAANPSTVEAPKNPAPEAQAPDNTQAISDARSDERKRFSTVMASEHYAGREALANKLLESTEMSAATIVETIAVAPKAEAPKAKAEADDRNHFAEAMDKSGKPQISGGESGEEEEDTPDKTSRQILSDFQAAGGQIRSPGK